MASTRNRRNGPAAAATTTTTATTIADKTSTTRSLRSTRSIITKNGSNNNPEDDGHNGHDNNKESDRATPLAANTEANTSQSEALTESTPTTNTRRRGVRLGTQTNTNNNATTVRSTRNGKSVAAATARSDSEEVELPRREKFESVVIINPTHHTFNSRKSLVNRTGLSATAVQHKDENTADIILDLQDPMDHLSSPTATTSKNNNRRTTIKGNTSTTEIDLSEWASPDPPLVVGFPTMPAHRRLTQNLFFQENQEKDLTPQQHLQAGEEVEDVDDMISRLSLSPPPEPSMFELLDDDYLGGGRKSGSGFTPWLMHFDSAEHSSEVSPSLPLSLVPYLRVTDPNTTVQLQQQPSVASTPTTTTALRREVRPSFGADADDQQLEDDTMDVEPDKEGDDPFGFFKVERQLRRRRFSRPKLLAINERLSLRNLSPLRNLRADSNDPRRTSSHRSVNEVLEKGVLERAAARRRGGSGAVDKGKSVERGLDAVDTTATVEDSVGNEPSAVEAAEIDKAIRLSLNDLAGVEKVGESSSSGVAVTEDVALGNDKDADDAVPRINRRISRRYGRSHLAAEAVADETPLATSATTTATAVTAATEGSRNSILELSDLFSPPSTPPQRSTTHHQFDPSSSDLFRRSIGSESLSPIVLATTPTKPEAGMPSSFESPDFEDRRKKPKKFMRTEDLQAMLPRPRKSRVAAAVVDHRNSKARSRARGGNTVFVVDSDDSAEGVEDNEEEEEEEVEEDEEEEEEVLVRRRHTRPAITSGSAAKAATTLAKKPDVSVKSTKAAATAAKSSQKRKAPVSTTTSAQSPVSKRQRPQKPSSVPAPPPAPSSKSAKTKATENSSRKEKEKEDVIATWTLEQRKALEERIRYFAQIDDFELEVESS
ncbi:hypothetical protein BGW39_008860 [Mortierella sp. 14UC]|nr:hypothetical protein BGW39_008860 [Mortierella sp. 14UC]